MQFTRESEYQNIDPFVFILEALTSGVIVAKANIGLTDELPIGCLLAKDSNGLGQLVKVVELSADATDAATTYNVLKSTFKVGQFIVNSALTGAAVEITAIDTTTNADYDVITTDATIGVALSEGDTLIEAAAAAAAGSAASLYTPLGIGMSTVDLTKANKESGVLVRGTVNEDKLTFPVPAVYKALLPNILFE